MASFNKVLLMGNLTRDPELRYTNSGTAVCGLGLAVNRTYKTQTGELKEDPCFVDVTAWGKQAESCNNYLKKGAPVFIEGSLRLESWVDKTSGQNRSKHTISAENIRFLGAPQAGSGGFSDNPGNYQQSQAPAAPQFQQPQQAQPPVQQAPQQQPNNSQAAQSKPSFEPPPMPEFNSEPEDDIPF